MVLLVYIACFGILDGQLTAWIPAPEVSGFVVQNEAAPMHQVTLPGTALHSPDWLAAMFARKYHGAYI